MNFTNFPTSAPDADGLRAGNLPPEVMNILAAGGSVVVKDVSGQLLTYQLGGAGLTELSREALLTLLSSEKDLITRWLYKLPAFWNGATELHSVYVKTLGPRLFESAGYVLDANGLQPVQHIDVANATYQLVASPQVINDTDDVPEGTGNLYYTEERVAQYYNENYAEFRGISAYVNPFTSGAASSGLTLSANSLNIYRDSSAVTIALTLPTAHQLPGFAGVDYGCFIEISYSALEGGIITFLLQNGAKVDTQDSFQVFPGDLVRLWRPFAPAGGSQKNFTTISITNSRYSRNYASRTGLFIPDVASAPGAPVGGSVIYRLASTGETWIKQPSGNTFKVANP